MKKNYEKHVAEMSALNEKCDLIIELLESVLDNPDFLIDRLRRSVEHQHRATTGNHPRMRIVRCHGTR